MFVNTSIFEYFFLSRIGVGWVGMKKKHQIDVSRGKLSMDKTPNNMWLVSVYILFWKLLNNKVR
jgi:hypothetical protein